jgi:SAM-dependent methyltransferase
MSQPGRCAACDGTRLLPHLSVAGQAGPDGFTPSTSRFGTALADIVRCASCGHMQLARFPPDDVLASAYADAQSADYVDEEAGQRASARRTLDQIQRHVPVGRLLDLGCWVGFLLDEGRRRGWRATGVEPSAFASAFARERLGLDVRRADLFAADLPPGSADAVVLADVIEHLVHPGAALDHIAYLSAPGAVLHLALPDAGRPAARLLGRRWWSVIPTHVQYFTRHSLSVLLDRHGWEVLELTTAPKAFSVGYYLGRVGGYSPSLARRLTAAASRTGLAERMWAPDFRDRMAVLARQPR